MFLFQVWWCYCTAWIKSRKKKRRGKNKEIIAKGRDDEYLFKEKEKEKLEVIIREEKGTIKLKEKYEKDIFLCINLNH